MYSAFCIKIYDVKYTLVWSAAHNGNIKVTITKGVTTKSYFRMTEMNRICDKKNFYTAIYNNGRIEEGVTRYEFYFCSNSWVNTDPDFGVCLVVKEALS